jgi:hypothetical protein
MADSALLEPHNTRYGCLRARVGNFELLSLSGLGATVRSKLGGADDVTVFATKLPDMRRSPDPSRSGHRDMEYVMRELTVEEYVDLCTCLVPFQSRGPCDHVYVHFLEYGRRRLVAPIKDILSLYDSRLKFGPWKQLWGSVGSVSVPKGLFDRPREESFMEDEENKAMLPPLFILGTDYRRDKSQSGPDVVGSGSGVGSASGSALNPSARDGGDEADALYQRPGRPFHRRNSRRPSLGEYRSPKRSVAQRTNTDVSIEEAIRAKELRRYGTLGESIGFFQHADD